MKRLISFVIFILGMLSINLIDAYSDIHRLEVIGNYLVVTDTTNNRVRQFPVGSVSYDVNGSYLRLYVNDNQRLNQPIDSLINSSNTAFELSTLNTFLRNNTGFNSAGASASSTGWLNLADGTFTEGSPLSLTSNEKVTLPMDGDTYLNVQHPTDVDSLFSLGDTAITGRNGDGIVVNIEFKAKPTSAASNIRIIQTIDIGGAVGEIRPREQSLTKGNGVEHNYLNTTAFYTLDTWEANGGKIKIQAVNGPIDVYDIGIQVFRIHKAR